MIPGKSEAGRADAEIIPNGPHGMESKSATANRGNVWVVKPGSLPAPEVKYNVP